MSLDLMRRSFVLRRILTLAAAVAVLCCGMLFAQKNKDKNTDTATRTVEGVLTDDAGAPVASGIVQLKDLKTLQVRSFITQEGGAYHFAGLSSNVDYELKAQSGERTSGAKTLSVFDSRKAAVINLKLNK